jgi:F1F0 ATPase subunit 2
MNDALVLTVSFMFGAGLGLLYFLGLWKTVRLLRTLHWTHLWLLVSLFLRLAILLYGFYWIGGGDWQRLVAALVGIILVRIVLTRRIGAVQAVALTKPSKQSAK